MQFCRAWVFRVCLPDIFCNWLRLHAGLEKKLMLVGQLNKFEIWSEEAWQQQIAEDLKVEQEGDFELNERLEDFSL